MKKIFKNHDVFPLVVLVLLIIIFFWKFFLKNLLPIPADITVGMYFPWLDYKWGFPAGVPVKNAILSDVVSVLYPIKDLAINLLKGGVLPLWNPYMFSGYPLLANFQIGLFNPANILYFILPNIFAWSWQVVLQPFFVGFFTYLFLRHLRLNRWASLLGSTIYAFSGFNIMWLEWNAHAWTAAFLPLLLLLTDKFFLTRKIKWGLLLSLSVAVQIFCGYPQLAMYSYMAMSLLVLWRHRLWQKTTMFWAGFIILGLALTSIQLLPAAEMLKLSQRQQEVLEKDTATLTYPGLITLFAPDFFGNHATLNYWGPGNYTINVGYTGIVAIILSSLAFLLRRQEFWVKYFLSLIAISLLFSLSTPFSQTFQNLKFIGFAAASGTRILFLLNFAQACLSAFAFDHIISKKPRWHWLKSIYLPAIVLPSFFIWTAIRYYLGSHSANLIIGLRNLVLPLIITFTASILFVLLNYRRRLKKPLLICLFALTVFELFRFGWKYLSFSRADLLFPSTPVIDFIKNQPGVFRVDGGGALPVNMWMAYGLESLAAYDAVYPLRTAEYIAAVNSGSIAKPQGRHGTTLNYSNRLLDLSNVCYFLAVKTNRQLQPDYQGAPGENFQLKKFKQVFEDKRVAVLKNNNCLPRAWVTKNYEIKTDQAIIDRLNDLNFNLRENVILESDPKIKLSGQKSPNENIVWKSSQANQQIIDVATDSDGFMVVSDSYYPGWEAYLDDQPTEIYRADFNYRAIYLPAGKHSVRFTYQPASVKTGLRLSLVALVIFTLLLVHDRINHRQSSRPRPSGVLPKGH